MTMTNTMTSTQEMIEMQQERVTHFSNEIIRKYMILDSVSLDTESSNDILDSIEDLNRMKKQAYKMLEFYMIRKGQEEMSKGN